MFSSFSSEKKYSEAIEIDFFMLFSIRKYKLKIE